MIRKLGGIATGMAIAVAIMIVFESMAFRLLAPGVGADQAPPVADTALPVELQLSVLASWFFGTLVGAYSAMWVSRARWTAWAVAAAVLLAVLMRFLLSATPGWLVAGGIVAPLVAAWLAQLLPSRRGPIA